MYIVYAYHLADPSTGLPLSGSGDATKTMFAQSHNSDPEMAILGGKVQTEVNKAGSFTFTIFPSHPYYNRIVKMKTLMEVVINGETVFYGRVLYTQTDFYKQKKVYCEGAMAFLLDSIQESYEYNTSRSIGLLPIDQVAQYYDMVVAEFLQVLLNNHNEMIKSEPDKRFAIGQINATGTSRKYKFEKTGHQKTLDMIQENLIENIGGMMTVRKGEPNNKGIFLYLDWKTNKGVTNQQPIEFGSNLIELEMDESGVEVFTRLYPSGKPSSNTNQNGVFPDDTEIGYHPVTGLTENANPKELGYYELINYTIPGEGGEEEVAATRYILTEDESPVSEKTYYYLNGTPGEGTMNEGQDPGETPDGLQPGGARTPWVGDYNGKVYVLYPKIIELDKYYADNFNQQTHLEDTYGVIVRAVEFSDCNSIADLGRETQHYIEKYCSFLPQKITLTAIDLRNLGTDYSQMQLGREIHVYSPPHGVDRSMMCVGIEYDLESPDKNVYNISSDLNDGKDAVPKFSTQAAKSSKESASAKQEAEEAKESASGAHMGAKEAKETAEEAIEEIEKQYHVLYAAGIDQGEEETSNSYVSLFAKALGIQLDEEGNPVYNEDGTFAYAYELDGQGNKVYSYGTLENFIAASVNGLYLSSALRAKFTRVTTFEANCNPSEKGYYERDPDDLNKFTKTSDTTVVPNKNYYIPTNAGSSADVVVSPGDILIEAINGSSKQFRAVTDTTGKSPRDERWYEAKTDSQGNIITYVHTTDIEPASGKTYYVLTGAISTGAIEVQPGEVIIKAINAAKDEGSSIKLDADVITVTGQLIANAIAPSSYSNQVVISGLKVNDYIEGQLRGSQGHIVVDGGQVNADLVGEGHMVYAASKPVFVDMSYSIDPVTNDVTLTFYDCEGNTHVATFNRAATPSSVGLNGAWSNGNLVVTNAITGERWIERLSQGSASWDDTNKLATVPIMTTTNSNQTAHGTGYDCVIGFSSVLQDVTESITSNGRHVIEPDPGKFGMSKVTVNVNVPGDPSISIPSLGQTEIQGSLRISIMENGTEVSSKTLYLTRTTYYESYGGPQKSCIAVTDGGQVTYARIT